MTTAALTTQPPAAIARATISHHSKSFALASALLGRRVRDQTAIVYTWCRRADDAVDAASSDPRTALAQLRLELDDVYSQRAVDPVLAAFAEVVRDRAIPRCYPDELLAGMAMDVESTRYRTLDDLITYCWRVAGVVGLMMSHVFGVSTNSALPRAVHLGIAMQLTNICRDVVEDWERGRLYVPDAVLERHGAAGLRDQIVPRRSDFDGFRSPRRAEREACGISATGGNATKRNDAIGDGSAARTDQNHCGEVLSQPLPPQAVPAIGRAVEELLALADRYYRSGDRGIPALPWRAALAVRAARGVYSAIGDRIACSGFDVTAGRAVVPRGQKFAKVAGAVGGVLASAPARCLRAATGYTSRIPSITLEYRDVPPP